MVLTYRDGVLQKAVTRGNGVVGEVITNNARVFKNLPAKIPFAGEVVLRGEAVIKYSDFKKINEGIEDVDARYKNPRNLCSGSVRQLNNEVTAKRNVFFFAFALVKAEGRELENSVESNMLWVQNLGFEIVPYKRVDRFRTFPKRLWKMIFHLTDLFLFMMISLMEFLLEEQRSSREIRLPLNGQTKKQRPGFYTLNGVRQEPVLLIRLPCLSQ